MKLSNRVLSDFSLEKEVYNSGTGAVYRAQVKETGQIVALKERRKAELGAIIALP